MDRIATKGSDWMIPFFTPSSFKSCQTKKRIRSKKQPQPIIPLGQPNISSSARRLETQEPYDEIEFKKMRPDCKKNIRSIS